MSSASASLSVRYSFTAQYLRSAAAFAQRATELERANPTVASGDVRCEHIGLVTAAIMQSAAAVEAESAEVMMHGPGHQLGSNGIDHAAKAFLQPLLTVIDHQKPLDRFNIILHLLGKPQMEKGEEPWQSMALVVSLRNELMHWKSQWNNEFEGKKLFKSLQSLRLSPTSFTGDGEMFFPAKFLSAAAALWAVRSSVDFLNAFYVNLGVQSVLHGQMQHFAGL